MQSVSTIKCKKILTGIFVTALFTTAYSQENSPYSRYGLGDMVNNTNILNRGMGGITQGFGSDRFLNNSNPASYSFIGQPLSRIRDYGKLVSFEVGSEFNSRTLQQKNPQGKYNSKNVYFNYMQLGMQLSKNGNWGANMGLLPLTRESYKIVNTKRLPGIDSILTVYEGTGGAYQAFIGSAYRVKNFSIGFNTGYTFGKKESTTNLRLNNDTTYYYESSSNTRTNFGGVFLNTGVMYHHQISKNKSFKVGATYNVQQKLRARENLERVTYENDNNLNPNNVNDTVFAASERKGNIVFPSTMGIGFTYEKEDAFLFGVDFTSQSWGKYRYYGQPDQLQNSWMVKSGIQVIPNTKASSYWSKASYRAGFYYGKDYIKAAGNDLPVYALTLGLGLPTIKPAYSKDFKAISPTVINLALEFGARGNSSNNLRENFVRIGLSVSLSDIWFFKPKYQ
jgi:hypothetical protein